MSGNDSPQSFADFEKENNPLLQLLRTDEAFADVRALIGLENYAVVFVPQSVCLDSVELTRQFVETHVAFQNPSNTDQFASLNGLCCYSTDTEVVILSEPLAEAEELTAFAVNRNAIFSWTPFTAPPARFETRSVTLLRATMLALGDRDNVLMLLVSEPLSFAGCSWETEVQKQRLPTPSPDEASLAGGTSPAANGTDGTDGSGGANEGGGESGGIVGAASSIQSTVTTFLKEFGRGRTPTKPLFDDKSGSPRTTNGGGVPNPLQDSPGGGSDGNVNTSMTGGTTDASARSGGFNQFLEKMRHPSAFELVKVIKTFITQFLESPPEPEDMSDFVRDFLADAEDQIRAHHLWKDATREELENAVEGLEKYVTNKIYSKAFAPEGEAALAQDRALRRRMASLAFLRPEHFDVAPAYVNDIAFQLAQKELRKMNSYKAPSDKLITALNCAKIIFNVLSRAREGGAPAGADEFLPILVYVVLRANPPNLHSNLTYIQRFRNPAKMMSESGYYFTHVVSAVAFIENLDADSLSIDEVVYEAKLREFEARFDAEQAAAAGSPDAPTANPEPGSVASSVGGGGASHHGTNARVSTQLSSVSLIDTNPPSNIDGPLPEPLIGVSPNSLFGSMTETQMNALGGGSSTGPLTTAPFGMSAGPPFVNHDGSQTLPGGAIDTGGGGGGPGGVGGGGGGARFLEMNVMDMQLRDVFTLLKDYKRLHEENASLKARVAELEAGADSRAGSSGASADAVVATR